MGTYLGTVELKEEEGSNLYNSKMRAQLTPESYMVPICLSGAKIETPIYKSYRIARLRYPVNALQSSDGTFQVTISDLVLLEHDGQQAGKINLTFRALNTSDGLVAQPLTVRSQSSSYFVSMGSVNVDGRVCNFEYREVQDPETYIRITIESTTLTSEAQWYAVLKSQTLTAEGLPSRIESSVPGTTANQGYGTVGNSIQYAAPATGTYSRPPIVEYPEPPPSYPPGYGPGYAAPTTGS